MSNTTDAERDLTELASIAGYPTLADATCERTLGESLVTDLYHEALERLTRLHQSAREPWRTKTQP